VSIRVIVADDQALVRDGLVALLEVAPDIEVVGQADNGEQAVALARRLPSDVVVMDIRMPVLDGLAATGQILGGGHGAEAPPPRVLVVTTFDLDEYVYEALAVGASGFVLKDASTDELIRAVRVVAAGDALLAPSVTRRLIAEFARRRPTLRATSGALAALTPRELEVLALIAGGLSNAEIAAQLVVAEQTVKTHVGRILGKLGLRDRAQAVVIAYETGLVRASS
jgi:DNA-binding NarL/FixJ family response regulator